MCRRRSGWGWLGRATLRFSCVETRFPYNRQLRATLSDHGDIIYSPVLFAVRHNPSRGGGEGVYVHLLLSAFAAAAMIYIGRMQV